jgi:hypothetical protein
MSATVFFLVNTKIRQDLGLIQTAKMNAKDPEC